MATVVNKAKASSLSQASWELLYPDLLRTIVPGYEPEWDRGRALETAWSYRDPKDSPGVDDFSQERSGVDRLLYEWGDERRSGGRPDVIFNATIVETGQPVALTTTEDLPPGMLDQRELLPDPAGPAAADVSAVTAARLSASFPYVSPAARARGDGEETSYHVVDGGYYDNYGISSLVAWLDDRLEDEEGAAIEKVLVVQIRGSDTGRKRLNGGVPVEGTKQGWFYQALAPAYAVLGVRGAGQLAHNDMELGLLKEKWCEDERGVDIETVIFEVDKPDLNEAAPPLSWHMTEDQKADIEAEWEKEDPQVERVKRFLERRDDSGVCPAT